MAKNINKDKKSTPKQQNDKQSTYILLGTLALCLTVLVVLGVLLVQKLSVPAANPTPDEQYIFIPNLEGLALSEAKALLEDAEISYEIIAADSKLPNRVLSFEYEGKTEDGKLLIELGTSVKLHANEVEQSKIVYLTFDDGPTSGNTFEILDILDEYDARATFFVQGQFANTYHDRMKETVERGHLVGCHSYTHIYGDIYSSTEAFLDEVERYESVMRDIFGDDFEKMPKLLRFPGGTTTIGNKDKASAYINEVRELGYAVYDWTALTGDRDGSNNHDKDYYLDNLKSSLDSAKSKNENLIILMHDFVYGKENLRYVMDFLVSEGYYFDTLDNCPEYTFAEK